MPPQGKTNDNRRTHKKSRTGCVICKQRRVKCDELRPRCSRCTVGNRPCKYAGDTPADAGLESRTPPTTTPLLTSLLGDGTGSAASGGCFTAVHMSLLYHAVNHMSMFVGLDEQVELITKNAIEASHTAPYLLDQLLALSALHLSFLHPDSAGFYQHHATELQTRAVTSFNDAQGRPENDAMADFLFATLLGIHVLRNTLSDHTQSLGIFVGGFVKYVRIHRGVRAVIARSWESILESDMKPLIHIEKWEQVIHSAPGTETAGLRAFLEAQTSLSAPSVEASLEALKCIQSIIDVGERDLASGRYGAQFVFAWPIVITEEFVDNLYQHRPEALVVLACFAAVMHLYRDFWVFGDTGHVLVELIAGHVGPFWEEALAWPLYVISAGREGHDTMVDGTESRPTPAPTEMYYGTPLT